MNTDKKYRLLKDISSPGFYRSKGSVGYLNSNEVYVFNNGTDKMFHYIRNIVENNPEWFEEVLPEQSKQPPISKDWEIVAYTSKTNFGFYAIMNKMPNGKWALDFRLGHNEPIPESEIIKLKDKNIHSVKRLSDGEVFQIGDTISWGVPTGYKAILTKFEIMDGRLKFYDDKLPEGRKPCDFINAIKLTKLPTPSPKEEDKRIEVSKFDELDITNNFSDKYSYYATVVDKKIPKDKFPAIKTAIENVLNDAPPKPAPSLQEEKKVLNWVVFEKDGFGFPTWEPTKWDNDFGTNWDDTVNTFEHKESADQFCLENKPCLSLNDLFLLGITEHHQYYKMMKILAKQKLNL